MNYNNALDLIGNTPCLKIDGVYVKQEFLNPSGSIKDRIAKYIVEKAEKSGKLKKGYTIVEATTGNTGIAFSMVAAIKGYNMLVVMPQGLSEEREEIIKSYGANIHFVKEGCVTCAVEVAKKLARKKDYFMPNQFSNPLNIEENEKLLGQEILKQVKNIEAFVAGVGTGGTLIGVGKAIKKKYPKAKLFAVEPDECPIISESGIGPLKLIPKHLICKKHKIEGIGDGFIPKIINDNKKLIDFVIRVKSEDAINETKRISREHGLLVGISSGANLLVARRLKLAYKNIVTVFPDTGSRYLSEHYFKT